LVTRFDTSGIIKLREQMKKPNYRIFTGFVLAVVLVIAAQGLAVVYRYTHQPEKLEHSFLNALDTRYAELNAVITAMADSTTIPGNEQEQRIARKLGNYTFLFVYDHNQLIYWSDNSILPDPLIAGPESHQRYIISGNGTYQVVTHTTGGHTWVLADLIKTSYKYQNEYLTPFFNPYYKLPATVNLTFNHKHLKDGSVKDTPMLKIDTRGETPLPPFLFALVYLLYLSAFIAYLYGIYIAVIISFKSVKSPVGALLFVIVVIASRAILQSEGIPQILTNSAFFSPVDFAFSNWLPSLGDLFTDTVLAFVSAFFTVRIIRAGKISQLPGSLRAAGLVVNIIMPVLLFYLSCYIIDILIGNSSFDLDVSKISVLSGNVVLAYFSIAFILAALAILSVQMFRRAARLISPVWVSGGALLAMAMVYFACAIAGVYSPDATILALGAAFMVLINMIAAGRIKLPSLTSIGLIILLLTLVSSYSIYSNKLVKERNERKLIALRLSSDRDKMGEYLFSELLRGIRSDTQLTWLFSEAWKYPEHEQNCIDYVKSTYFRGYWSRYNVQVTLCFPDKNLQIKPSNYIIGCQDYFSDIIQRLGEPATAEHLYFIHESYDASSYIANIPMPAREAGNQISHLVIEFTPKYVPKGLGYPELLMDKPGSNTADISDYSYALFFKNELVKNVGDYNYGMLESLPPQHFADFDFFDRNGYSHLYHVINKDTSIVISLKKNGILDSVSPFTYQLIFHILLVLLGAAIYNKRKWRNMANLDFKTRLQLMLVVMVLFASISVGTTTLYNIRNLNEKKNRDMLSEKSHSVLIELENKLASLDILDKSQKDYLEELLTKFSMVFFSDINLYNTDGRLLASSRPQIFEEGLKSELMGVRPFHELAKNKRALYIDNEKIGNYQYLSAYVPFRNAQNKLTAYINLPYFAREQELRQEISTFLITFINIYLILTVLAVMISIVAGNYLMRPLQLIRNRFGNINLSAKNEKIAYNRKDELGDLIQEYNLMVDKLAESAEKLARSERESAWREMARQVAHEIKNPLTPMKLSIQHLYKSWDEKAPDWGYRLQKTTQTLIEQIDSLAAIATAFSDFAKLPVPSNSKTELTAIIRATLSLYHQHPDINFSFTLPDEPCYVFADEKQLSRVFINLLNNAVQAMQAGQPGKIDIRLLTINGKHIVEVADNGSGIDEEKKPLIFSPNFTTKSSGMGLGLAMVRNIIDSAGGSIRFESVKGIGTKFIIELPAFPQ